MVVLNCSTYTNEEKKKRRNHSIIESFERFLVQIIDEIFFMHIISNFSKQNV